jgi:ubiquinone/menaquinone biosynthesis C-methylase UbiE
MDRRSDSRAERSPRDVERFGRWAPHYERSLLQRFFLSPIQTATIAEIGREVAQPTAILDIGCGTGVLLRRLASVYPHAEFIGVDAAAGMIREARATLREDRSLRFLEARAEELPFPAGSFDLVVSTMSFHHWADQQRGLAEVRRVLRPDGVFVLTDVIVGPWLSWALSSSNDRVATTRRLEAMLAAASLRCKRSAAVPSVWLQYGRRITVAKPDHREGSQ